MFLYKYRDLRTPEGLDYLRQILSQHAFWAARPDKLNDPEEFMWACDYAPTDRTKGLLADVLYQTKVRSAADALYMAHVAIEQSRLEAYAKPVFTLLQARCRDEIGVISFGTSDANPSLWHRYGGKYFGVCVEVEVANDLIGAQLREVTYQDRKSLHIDQVLEASLDGGDAASVFQVALLTKPLRWRSECEFRFLSKKQNVSIKRNASPIRSITLGRALTSEIVSEVMDIVANLDYSLEVRDAKA